MNFDEGVQPVIRVAKREGWADELKIHRYPRVGGEKIGANKKMSYRSAEPIYRFSDRTINRLYDELEPQVGQWKWKASFEKEAPLRHRS